MLKWFWKCPYCESDGEFHPELDGVYICDACLAEIGAICDYCNGTGQDYNEDVCTDCEGDGNNIEGFYQARVAQ